MPINLHKLTLMTLATLCAFTGILALASTPALAGETYGLEGSFGSATSTTVDPEPLSEPAGVAVNDSTGEVYVVDAGNERVERFSSTGTYLSQFNGSVGPPTSVFSSPQSIAVDNSDNPADPSAGDVYVADPGHDVIDKFTASGTYLSQLTGFTKLEGITVDPSGDLWVEASEGPHHTTLIDRFNDATTNSRTSEWYTPSTIDFAPGATYEHEPVETVAPTIAVDSQDNVYLDLIIVNESIRDTIYKFSANGELLEEMSEELPSRGLAVEESTENIFVDTQKSIFDEAQPLNKSRAVAFGAEAGLSSYGSVAVRSGVGTVYVTDAAKNIVDIFSLGLWPEEVVASPATSVTSGTAILNGSINPNGAKVTSCRFEYGTSTSYGKSAPCTQTPEGTGPVPVSASISGLGPNTTYYFRLVVGTSTGAVYVGQNEQTFLTLEGPPFVQEESAYRSSHGATLVAGINIGGLSAIYSFEYGTSTSYGAVTSTTSTGASSGIVSVSAKIEGLSPETTYHFRVIVTNQDGTTIGADSTFTTQSPTDLSLPDGRGYEMVSPVGNVDGDVYEVGFGYGTGACSKCSLYMRASANGDAVLYPADPLATDGTGQGANQFVATRVPGNAWSSVDLSTPGFDGSPFEALFSSELSNSGSSTVPAGTYSLDSNSEGLFDSVGGRLVPVSVLPDGGIVTDATFGSLGSPGEEQSSVETGLSHVVSADGSRIFWTDLEEGADSGHVFVRENNGLTVAVSVGAARFWTATPDGNDVFYTEGERLWRFDVEAGTREEIAGKHSGVLGVIGLNETGEDGAYVYFVANGVLGDGAGHGATAGNCEIVLNHNKEEANCNLYVRHDGETTFIATLSPEDVSGHNAYDESATVGVVVASVGLRTAEVSANGHALVFLSYASLTGYENNGKREVYVYDADSGKLSCASCNPSGEPAATSTPYNYLPLTPSQSNTYMHRWISEDGSRVFFDSPEALVAQDTNGQIDVYEWERDGTGSCLNVKGCVFLLSGGTSPEPSYLLDASMSGNDVFMITRSELVPEDQGETDEVYDARVDASQPLTEPACTGTGCQGLPSAPPPFATPSSVTFNGVGNFSPVSAPAPGNPKAKAKPAKCKTGFVKKKDRCVKKPKAKKSTHHKGSK